MKKTGRIIIAAIISGTLICTGCFEKAEAMIYETAAAQVSENVTKKTMAEEVSSEYDGLFKDIGGSGDTVIGVKANGKYELIKGEDYYNIYYIETMTSRETYEEYMEYLGEDEKISYEEFKEEMYGSIGVTEEDIKKFSSYRVIYVVDYFSEDKTADHSEYAARGFKYAVKKIKKSGIKNSPVFINIVHQEDTLTLYAGYEDKNGSAYILEDERICIYGDGYVLIGSKAVPKNTKSLYITSEDEKLDKLSNGTSAQEYESVIYEYPGKAYESYGYDKEIPELDLTDIAKKFPKLQKLYVSGHTPLKGIAGLAKYESFEELCISSWQYRDYVDGKFVYIDETIDDIKSIKKLKKLRINDVDAVSDIEWAKYIKAELVINCGYDDDLQKFTYTLPNVTELNIITGYNGYAPDLSGIENCKSLKKLGICTDYSADHEGYADGVPDFAPLAGSKSLEELIISGDNGRNFDAIGNIKTLKRLSLHGVTYNENREKGVDLSVLKNCRSLEYLDLYEVDDSIFAALPYMKKLKTLKLGQYCRYLYDGLEDIKGASSVEKLIFDNRSVSLNGISELANLKILMLDNCEFKDTADLNKCKKLKKLSISLDSYDPYEKFDVETIEENKSIKELHLKNVGIMHYSSFKKLTALKKLTLDCTDLTAKQTAKLKKEMPWCEIKAARYVPSDDDENEKKALSEYKSKSEPYETLNIGDVRVEKYEESDNYWNITLIIKNNGKESIKDLTVFMEENGLIKGYERAYIRYPAHDGHSEVTETADITDKGFDRETSEVYISIFEPYEEDYTDNDLFRELVPGTSAEIMLHIPDKEDKKQK